jgi:hypothetical protein
MRSIQRSISIRRRAISPASLARTIRPAQARVRVAGHEGEDAGATTALFIDRAAGIGAVVLTKGDAFSSGDSARAAAIQTLLVELLAVASLSRGLAAH